MAGSATTDLTLVDGMQFVARSGSGHAIPIDAGAASGGDGSAATPVELVLTASASCMAMDAVAILRKMRQDVAGYRVHAEGVRADQHPRVFTSITMTHRLHGRALVPANVARALQLSMSRYCPVFAMLQPGVAFVVRYEVTDDADGSVTAGEAVREGASAVEAS
jgi:putative redox protein